MAVDTQHPEYKKMVPIWTKCRHVAIGGEDVVKEHGEDYLPRLEGQKKKIGQHDRYEDYKKRALFYSASERTVQGLSGMIFRKPVVVMPDGTGLAEIDDNGSGIDAFCMGIVIENIVQGRAGILVEMGKDGGKPYFVKYNADKITNWKFSRINGESSPELIVLKEQYEVEGDDEFDWKTEDQYRVLKLDDGRRYIQEIWRKKSGDDSKWVLHETITPTVLGRGIDDIPFIFINPVDSSPEIKQPPILPVVNVNLSRYRSSADLEHGRHFTALPIPYLAGFKTGKNEEVRVGSDTAYVSNDPSAKAGYAEFVGHGLKYAENALEQKESLMAILGARMLESQKKSVEATDTHKMRKVGENSTLTQIARATSSGINKALAIMWEWKKDGSEAPTIGLNTDFITDGMTPQEIEKFTSTWQTGGMSWKTLFHNFKKGEMYPDGWTEEQERDAIKNDMPGLGAE